MEPVVESGEFLEKKKSRADRFGIAVVEVKPIVSKKEEFKNKKNAEKEMKKKRAERFQSAENKDEDDKKRKRLERFTEVIDPEVAAKLAERAKRFAAGP